MAVIILYSEAELSTCVMKGKCQMMNRNWKVKVIVFKLALLGAIGVHLGTDSVASAASSCKGAGYLCFYDYGSAEYGNLFGDNTDWRVFSWNDRADVFKNDGRTSNSCVFEHINYGGIVWFIPRNGVWYDVPDNTISSNRWITSSNINDCFL